MPTRRNKVRGKSKGNKNVVIDESTIKAIFKDNDNDILLFEPFKTYIIDLLKMLLEYYVIEQEDPDKEDSDIVFILLEEGKELVMEPEEVIKDFVESYNYK